MSRSALSLRRRVNCKSSLKCSTVSNSYLAINLFFCIFGICCRIFDLFSPFIQMDSSCSCPSCKFSTYNCHKLWDIYQAVPSMGVDYPLIFRICFDSKLDYAKCLVFPTPIWFKTPGGKIDKYEKKRWFNTSCQEFAALWSMRRQDGAMQTLESARKRRK